MEKEVSFYSNGIKLSGIINIPDRLREGIKLPLIVFSHGYGSGRNALGDFKLISEILEENNTASLIFDKRGSGYSEYLMGKKLCGTEWNEDIVSAVSFVSCYPGIDPSRVGLIGESMGGANVIQTAALDTRVKCIIALAPIADGFDLIKQNWLVVNGEKKFNEFLSELEEDRMRRTIYGTSNLIKLTHAMAFKKNDVQLVKELHNNVDDKNFSYYVRFESVESVMNMRPIDYIADIAPRPILIMAGKKDTIVPWERHSKLLFKKAGVKKKLILFDEGGHKLLSGTCKDKALKEIIKWTSKYL